MITCIFHSRRSITGIIVMVAVLLGAYHKDISGTGATPTEAFTDIYWNLETITVSRAVDLDMDGKPDTDMRILMEECDKDDAEMYKSNNKVFKDEGTEKCVEDASRYSEVGSWKYDGASKMLTVKKMIPSLRCLPSKK